MTARRRFGLTPLRFAVAAAVAIAGIGGGAAYAAGLVHGGSATSVTSSCPAAPAGGHSSCGSTAAHAAGGAGSKGAKGANRSNGSGKAAGNGGAASNDAHGDAVSNAAHTCPKTPPGAHGQCVSRVASSGRSDGDGAADGNSKP